MTDVLTLEQVAAREPVYFSGTFGDEELSGERVLFTLAERDAIVRALRGQAQPTCATCRHVEKVPLTFSGVRIGEEWHCRDKRLENPMGGQETARQRFGCTLHEPTEAS